MSTAPPTTLVPTTLTPTTIAGTDIYCGPIEIVVSIWHTASYFPAWGRDYSRDYLHRAGPIEITSSVLGGMFTVSIAECVIDLTLEILGTLDVGTVIECDPIDLVISIAPAYYIVESRRCNWIKWSKIGKLDFTIDESNLAGERPVDWKGCIYAILKLGDKVVVYGENGVTILTAVDVNYGMQTVHRTGVVCNTAVVGTEFEHYFIDLTNKLYKLSSEGLQLLDYSEYLALLNFPTMALDTRTGAIYICDDTYGFVYSTLTKSFGVGPINVTGIGVQSGLPYVVAPAVIATPKFNVCTDIYDLGTRKYKTIQHIEVGVDLTNELQAMVETRLSNKDSFIPSRWSLVNPNGIAYVPSYGVEFKFHLRSFVYEYFEIDYLKVAGVVHGSHYLDSLI